MSYDEVKGVGKIKSFIDDPEAHVGEMVSYEARIDEITYVRGGLKIRARRRMETASARRIC